MTKYIQGKDGKFAGSIGDGKTNTPTLRPLPSPADAAAIEAAIEARFTKLRPHAQCLPSECDIARTVPDQIAALRDELKSVAAGNPARPGILDTANNELSTVEQAYAAFNARRSAPLDTVEALDARINEYKAENAALTGKVEQALTEGKDHKALRLGGRIIINEQLISTHEKAKQALKYMDCGFDGCKFQMPRNGGMAPPHDPAQPGHSSHCTCNACF